jgi:hypothetical protein
LLQHVRRRRATTWTPVTAHPAPRADSAQATPREVGTLRTRPFSARSFRPRPLQVGLRTGAAVGVLLAVSATVVTVQADGRAAAEPGSALALTALTLDPASASAPTAASSTSVPAAPGSAASPSSIPAAVDTDAVQLRAAREKAAVQNRAAAAAAQAARNAQRDPRGAARAMLADHGWGAGQFACLDSLWAKESGWRPTARNTSSGAYGIPQALPATKLASAGADWQTNPVTQIRWGLTYIKTSYGSPCAAWSHSRAMNWY